MQIADRLGVLSTCLVIKLSNSSIASHRFNQDVGGKSQVRHLLKPQLLMLRLLIRLLRSMLMLLHLIPAVRLCSSNCASHSSITVRRAAGVAGHCDDIKEVD